MKTACVIWLAMCGWMLAAALDFPAVFKEVHAPADAKTVTVDFEFANHSDKPVSIAKYNAACSCISAQIKDGKLRYAPGEAGLIRTEFDMGNFSGTVDKIVAVWLDNDPEDKPSLTLTVRVHIPVLVSLEPKTVKWDLGGKAEPKSIRIGMNYAQPIRVVSVHSSSEAFKYELKTIEEGKSYELLVTPLDMQTPGMGIFRIETDCQVPRHRIQQAFATVRKPSPTAATVKP
jgi:hypothetical protein